ncbi:MAG: FAD-binding oxidoreductase [Candidatus Microsaccharimonas sossegonensis]|uniref:FAD-binding oxidoreductase n=1 Tax=Candidatus Microsaccharimonas sossegonensis TaxID=2506948 RepID=A0A4Q0AHQ1_9BACT|nr:MAG: FAD-binding oxidoreductase [Candidatus Microsaccharimonas sossegonensis]
MHMDTIKNSLKEHGFNGDLDDSAEALTFYSHDASMFELMPKLVLKPKNTKDVETAVKVIAEEKQNNPDLSLTARSAGTDMSGAAINESIIVDFQTYFRKIISVENDRAVTQPGVFFRDFDAATGDYLLPSYPASRDLASVGGMINNNSGGEKSLEFGKTELYVPELKFVFSDGIERVVRPLSKAELDQKMAQDDFEGKVYKELFELIDGNYEKIKAAKPHVSKNSTGYNLWNVWDRETSIFDMTQMIIGAQGTLGFVTEGTFKLVPRPKHSGLLVLFMHEIDDLGELIKTVMTHKPATFEGFDDQTLLLSMKFMPSFLKILGPVRFIHLLITLIPDGFQLLRGIPKLVLMVEFTGETEDEVRSKITMLHKDLSKYRARYEINGFEEDPTEGKSEKFWIMRRYSFQLLRSKVKDKHTAPFIDDLIVNPEHLPEFLPQIRNIIKKYKLFATIAGHMGDGNFHIIPLMKLEDPNDRAKLLPAMKEVNELVLKYKGSLSGEHNDGLVRGPWLEQMYGKEIVDLFRAAKDIFDPQHIFNPHKKANAEWGYSFSHIREKF